MFKNLALVFLGFAIPLLISVAYFTLAERKVLAAFKDSNSALKFTSFHPNKALIPLLLAVVGISFHLTIRSFILDNPITWKKIYFNQKKGLLFVQLLGVFVTVVIIAGLLFGLACFVLNTPIFLQIQFLTKFILGLWADITPPGLVLKFILVFEFCQQIPYLGVIIKSLIAILIDICVLAPQIPPYLDLFGAVKDLITLIADLIFGPLTPLLPNGELPLLLPEDQLPPLLPEGELPESSTPEQPGISTNL